MALGYMRVRREFVWTDGGRTLNYRIVDAPASRGA